MENTYLHYYVKWPKEISYRDLTKPLPFYNNSVDFVYTSHFLEHLYLDTALNVIKEILRVLKSGGIVRIVLPDLKYFINKYVEDTQKIPDSAADIFIRDLCVIRSGRDPHLWMYDYDSINKKLHDIGFLKIERGDYKKGKCKDANILDNRPYESLFIEAIK